MNINEFIDEFFEVFDEVDRNELTPFTKFRDIDEWSSLHGLATLNMLERVFDKKITVGEFLEADTIQDLFDLVQNK